MKTDWNQVDIRNVNDGHESETLQEKIDLNMIIGECCPGPLTCVVPFLVDLTERNDDQDILEIKETWSQEFPEIKVAMRYSNVYKFPAKLTSDCILELDGPEIDTRILKSMKVGAFYIDIGKAYYKLEQSNSPIIKGDTDKDTELRTIWKTESIIDMNCCYREGRCIDKWISLIRRLRPNIPFGIRIPANYIERDCVFASRVGIDFIILDCRDTSCKENAVIPSLAAIARAKHILSKLSCDGITVITGIPPVESSSYVKLFAMGARMLLFPDQKERYSQEKRKGRKEYSDYSPGEIVSAFAELKQSLHRCGCRNLKEIGMEHLVTPSSVISSYTGIAMTYAPDPVVLPFYSIKKQATRGSIQEK